MCPVISTTVYLDFDSFKGNHGNRIYARETNLMSQN